MSKLTTRTEQLTRALTTPAQGILGLVEDLLKVSCEHDIRLDWQAGRCHVSAPKLDRIEVAMQKSVMRAVLARIAALCNERIPNSVSPYGGSSALTMKASPNQMIGVRFVNTPDEQWLELTAAAHVENEHASEQPRTAVVQKGRPLPAETDQPALAD